MNAQDALWLLPTELGTLWWLICAAFALPAASIMLLKLIINEPFGLLTVSRSVIVGSLVAFGMAPLNSGWIPWGILMASVGGCMAAVLLATGWCNRPNPSASLSRTVWNWISRPQHQPKNGAGD